MNVVLKSLFAVAEELANLAKSSTPELRQGEIVKGECLKDGIYYRESIFENKTYQSAFDFKQRKSLMTVV